MMPTPLTFAHRRLLVTGASSGLGLEMARQLALKHRANLVLVARRADRLTALKQELESQAGVHCQVLAADLSRLAEVERVYAEATAAGDIDGVILNAGITHFGNHLDLDWAGFQTLLDTNVTGVIRLVNLFTPALRQRPQGGGIMLVSSMAGLLPVPYQAAYAGSKAFITNFALSLREELRGQGVSLTVFSPGGIDTAMTRDSKLNYFANTALLQDVASCAAEGLAAMAARRGLYVPGRLNRLQLLGARLAPRELIAAITRTAYRKALAAV